MAAELHITPSRATDADLNAYSGARWIFYATGTTTPQAVFADAALGDSLGHIVTADSGGKFVPIYLDASLTYRGICENASGSIVIHDIDPINSTDLANATTITSKFTYSDSIVHSTERFSFGLEDVLQSTWGGGFENNTRFFVGNNIGRAGVAAFSRSSDNPTTGDMATYAFGAFVEHDSDKYAWAGYDEIRRRSGAGSAHGRETAVINFGALVQTDPYNASPTGMTDVSRLSVGRSDTPTNTSVSAYQSFVKVGAQADKGLVIASDALIAYSGQSDAINLATGHALQWWTAAGTRGARVRDDGGANPMGVIFANNVISFQNNVGATVLQVNNDRILCLEPIRTPTYTVATLPSATIGERAMVSDASGPTFGATLTGGGAGVTPVFHDGTVWRVG